MKVTRILKLMALLALVPCVLLATHARAAPQQNTVPAHGADQPGHASLTPDQRRRQAVQRARSGDYAPAIDSLERILGDNPDNLPAYYDLLIILGWAEQDRKVLLLAERLDPDSAPLAVINTLGKSARNVGDFVQSVHWYTLAVTRAPANLENNLGRALALADLGQHADALAVLAALPGEGRETPRLLMARGYIRQGAGDYTQAMVAFDRVLAIEPDHRGALRGEILALQSLQLPAEALEIADAHPGVLDNSEIGRLRTDWAAVQIRWANQTATPKPFADRSLERALSTMASTAEQFSDDDIVQQRTRFDRIVAYRSLQNMAAAIAEFEQLEATPLDVPVYVLTAAAGAYLHLRQPKEAEVLLLQALQKEPGNFQLQQDMFWVHVDLERQPEALALAKAMRRSQPMWLEEPGSAIVRGNPRRLQAEIMVGLALSFMDQLPEAQAYFEQLLAIAPNNTDLQHELATVLRQRGWTERALFEYRQALAVEPDLVAAAVGNAHALLDHRKYELGAGHIDTLVAEVPARPDVLRLADRWAQINQYQYRIDSSFGNSSGDQFGSRQYTVDAIFFAQPLAYRFRPFIHSTDAFAEFPEGNATRRRLGAGIEYRSANWMGSLELHGSREGGGDAGVTGDAEWFLSDIWSVGGNIETESAAVPLRGQRTGLSADKFGVRLRYRASELRDVSLSAEQTRISDGNTRTRWSLQGHQRMITRPAYKLDLDAGVFLSGGDAQDVVYFNPNGDAAFLVTAINDWRTYRRYDFTFRQRFNIEFGFYQQSSHGTHPIGSLAYLANVDINQGFSVNFGMQYGRRVYDGSAEYLTFFTFGVAGGF